jgi:hypothetical protein
MTDTYLKWLLESVGPKVERIYRVRDCPTKFVAFFEEKPNRLPPFLPPAAAPPIRSGSSKNKKKKKRKTNWYGPAICPTAPKNDPTPDNPPEK